MSEWAPQDLMILGSEPIVWGHVPTSMNVYPSCSRNGVFEILTVSEKLFLNVMVLDI